MSAVSFNISTSKISNVVSGVWTSDNVTIDFHPPVVLPAQYNWEVGIARLDTWNSIHNIKSVFNNNQLRYSPDSGTTWKALTIPDGNYEIQDINTALQNFMYDNGDYDNTNAAEPRFYINFVEIIAEGKLRIEITNNYRLDLSIGDLHTLLGFDAIILTATSKGTNAVDITRGVDSWSVHCSLAGGSYDNDIGSDILYGFVPLSGRGMAVSERPFQVFFFPLNATYVKGRDAIINSIQMRLTDQLNRPILLNGDDITYRLIIRPALAAEKN